MELNSNSRYVNQEVKNIITRHQKAEPAFERTVLEGKERRYTLINEKDRAKYLTEKENEDLDLALDYYLGKIEEARAIEGKEPFNSYIVINTDEPYVPEIVEVMKRNGHFE